MRRLAIVMLPSLFAVFLSMSFISNIKKTFNTISYVSLEVLEERTILLAEFGSLIENEKVLRQAILKINDNPNRHSNVLHPVTLKPLVDIYSGEEHEKLVELANSAIQQSILDNKTGCKHFNHVVEATDVCWKKIYLPALKGEYIFVYGNKKNPFLQAVDKQAFILLGGIILAVLVQAYYLTYLLHRITRRRRWTDI